MSETHRKNIKYGFPVLTAGFKKIKAITSCLTIILVINLIYSCKLFISSIRIRIHLGYFINMISTGDGDVLPSLQAVPVLLLFLIDMAMLFVLYFAFGQMERSTLNLFMLITVLVRFFLLIVTLIIVICIMAHIYSAHVSLHDGITTAMKNYSTNLLYKRQIDELQIEFQCCGSKKYDEWYTTKWMDASLEQEGISSSTDGHTPFSCCSMKSLFPCIHHSIETTGKAYLYTPEFNLSISTRGCYNILREQKQTVGWGIIGNLMIFFLLESACTALFRLIQTAHSEKCRFSGHDRTYTIWIFGYYKESPKKQKPPPLPPLPIELKE